MSAQGKVGLQSLRHQRHGVLCLPALAALAGWLAPSAVLHPPASQAPAKSSLSDVLSSSTHLSHTAFCLAVGGCHFPKCCQLNLNVCVHISQCVLVHTGRTAVPYKSLIHRHSD